MNRLTTTLAGLAVTSLLTLSACGSSESVADDNDAEAKDLTEVEIVVPADPGGGWDQTGRSMAEVMESEDLVDSAKVTNEPGAGGTTGLASLANAQDPYTLMVMGYVMVGAVELNKSQATLADVTPIAELTEEQEVVVVPADSPYQTIDDLIADAEANGKDVTIAGGSAGGTDHILAGMIYQAAGIDPSSLNYVPYDGGGESVAALLGGKVDAGISGAGEYREQVAAGELRALAVSGEGDVAGYEDAKPLSEQGIDVVLTNWRGVVAPGGISDAEQEKLIGLVDQMHESDAWQEALTTNDWTDAYLTGPDFGAYIETETETVKGILDDIGLTQ